MRKKKFFLEIGLLALLFPIYFIATWFYVVMTLPANQALRQKHFYSFFPFFFNNSFYLTLIAILFCVLAFVFGFMALGTKNKWIQAAALTLMGTASLLGLWFGFSLM